MQPTHNASSENIGAQAGELLDKHLAAIDPQGTPK
jgi:hypothetical protein